VGNRLPSESSAGIGLVRTGIPSEEDTADQVAGDVRITDLSGEDDHASRSGVQRPEERPPPPDHIRRVANQLLLIFGVSIILILLLTTAIAWGRTGALKDVIGFFSTVVATLGTLLGGVVAFYFARR
jgi:hypothetical protein